MSIILTLVAIAAWIWLLLILRRAELKFWHYILGAAGLFTILMLLVRPVMTLPLARIVAAVAGIFGKITDFYQAYFRYGVIFIESGKEAITVNIDLECSGIIEISAFLSLIVFFEVYSIPERIYFGIIGALYTLLSNSFRIAVICTFIHFAGPDYYYIAHTLLGRIVFYVLQVLLYFFVFTRYQVRRTRTGDFEYSKEGLPS